MKPLEGGTLLEGGDSELEFEMPSKQFFQDIGMLVVEGRVPHCSDRGRIEGLHCPSLLGTHNHTCDTFNKLTQCQHASARLQKMEELWQCGLPMHIDVSVDIGDTGVDGRKGEAKQMVLVERWKVELQERLHNLATSGHMLLQAIRSNIHFSQLSAWLSSSKGVFPQRIIYRIYGKEDCGTDTSTFVNTPKHHVFPLATLPNNAVLHVEVHTLPRFDLHELWHVWHVWHVWHARHSAASHSICNSDAFQSDNGCDVMATDTFQSDNGCDVMATDTFRSDNGCDVIATDKKFAFSSPLRKKSCRLEKSYSSEKQGSQVEGSTRGRTSKKFHNLSNSTCDQSSPDQELVVSNGLHQATAEQRKTHLVGDTADHCIKTPSDFKIVSKDLSQRINDKTSDATAEHVQQNGVSDSKCRHHIGGMCGCPSRSNGLLNTSKPNPKLLRHMIQRRSVPTKSCTIPIFNAKTGLPISSSPAVLRRSTTELNEHDSKGLLLSDSLTRPEYRDLSKVLSKSAPASTALSGLLGNFEESVLNGRMEPVGTVEGFAAELGASGTFCPSHVMLPITAYFFKLSDDDAPSPYMGYISLEEPLVGRRGYHVPRKGTIQLTVFNPNKTVVKVFVVLYNFADMPPKSQTFLRQRTFSVCKVDIGREAQTTLHYLVHLRFTSSRSGRIYLHTDIRVIFARQPPDFDGHPDWDVRTVTDGPTNPRYTPKSHEL